MPEKLENKKYSRIDWNKMKAKFITGSYKSLRDFAKKLNLSYNGNFLRKTRGWATERAAKRLQISCKIVENFVEKEAQKMIEINEKINKINNLALDAAEKFFINKDYQHYIFKEKKAKRDEHDNYVLNKKGELIKINTVDVVESPFVRIDKVKQAIMIINNISKTIKNIGSITGYMPLRAYTTKGPLFRHPELVSESQYCCD